MASERLARLEIRERELDRAEVFPGPRVEAVAKHAGDSIRTLVLARLAGSSTVADLARRCHTGRFG